MKVAKIQNQNNLKKAILQAVDQLGGFEKFIKTGDTILLKPNLNTADPPPASSDLEFIKTVTQICLEAGAKKIIIGESSTIYLSTQKVMEEKNLFSLKKDFSSCQITIFDKTPYIKKTIEKGKYIKAASFPKVLDEVDKIFLLPCLKTHRLAQFTGSLKLAVGFLKKNQRLALHFSHLQEKIAEINLLYKPDLIIMDARKCFITGGPDKGTVAEPSLILASTNRLAIDIEGIKIIQSFPGNSLEGINPHNLPQIKRAIEIGLE